MEYLTYFIVIVLVTAWSIGFIGYGMGGLIHILPVLAVITVIMKFVRDSRVI